MRPLERRHLGDLEAAGQTTGALRCDGEGVFARVDADVVAAELEGQEATRPGDSAAQVEHGDAGADGRSLGERSDLRGADEALLLDVLVGAERLLLGRPRVEGAVGRDEEAEIEKLEQDDRAEHEPSDPCHDAPGAGRQGNGQADDDESLEGKPHEGA
jgi:hypothetical protein